MEFLVEVRNISKRYGKRWILKNVDFKLPNSTTLAIIGENGSGKTTLLKILSGLIKPTKGEVFILGENINEGGKDFKKHIGVLFHENILYEELTVLENLNYYARMYGLKKFEESALAMKYYREFGLEMYENVKVANLSYGWRKRANIIRALLNNPKVLLLDEPFSGLDKAAFKTMVKLMNELSKDRVIIFTMPTAEIIPHISDLGGKLLVSTISNGRLLFNNELK